MRERSILYIDGTGSERLFNAVADTADTLGATLLRCSEEEIGVRLTELIATGRSPAAVLIAPGMPDPLELARRIRNDSPGTRILFLVDGAESLSPELRESSTSVDGWMIASIDDGSLSDLLRDAAPPDNLQRAMGSADYLATILDQAQDAIIAIDNHNRILTWNRGARMLFGHSVDGAIGRSVEMIIADPDAEAFRGLIDRVRCGEAAIRHEILCRRDNDSTFYAQLSLACINEPGKNGSEEMLGIALIAHDITARKARELERVQLLARERASAAEAEIARRRLEFLAEASEILASSLDYETTLRSVTRLAVPHLADWCAVDILGEDGSIELLAVAHIDPSKVEWAYELRRMFPPDPSEPTGLPNVLRTGRSEFYPHIPREALLAAARNDEHLRIIDEIGFTSLMIVPIVVDSRPIGAITFVSAESGRGYESSDLVLAEDLGRRASMAIENARLYREVRRQHESLRVTLASIGDAVITTDRDGRITFLNGVARAVTGWSEEEARGRMLDEVFNIVNETTGIPVESPAEKVLRTGAIIGLANHTILIAKDGSRIPIDDSAAPIRDSDGNILGVVMVFRDITERKQAENELSRILGALDTERLRLDNIMATVPGIVWESRGGKPNITQQRLTFVSDYIETLLGYSVDEWLSDPDFWISTIHPDDRQRVLDLFSEHLNRGTPGILQLRLISKEGIPHWCETHFIVVQNEEEVGIRGVTMDITARKTIEMRLREQTETLETVNRIGQIVSAELDLDTMVQAVTDAATELTGARFGSFFYNTVTDDDTPSYMLYTLSGVPREHFSHFPMPRATDLFGPTFRGEGIIRIADVKKDPRYGKNSPYYGIPPGHLPVVSYLAVPVVSRSGEVIGGLFFGHPEPGVFTERAEMIVVGLAAQTAIAVDNARLFAAAQREIQERARTEIELKQARDSAEAANRAKDQFLAMLSHELRTPLTPVLALTHVLETAPDIPSDHHPLIEMIRRNIELEARLIDDLLDLTRISKGKLQLHFELVDAHALMRNVFAMCQSDIDEKNLHLTPRLDAPRHHVEADSARLQQVFWNLVKNAVKFTPDGGSITIRSSNRGDRLIIEVIDNGFGIEPELMPTIFKPFEQGEEIINRRFGGLGLGLAISRSIVDMHGGTLEAASPGRDRGATFTLELAAADPADA